MAPPDGAILSDLSQSQRVDKEKRPLCRVPENHRFRIRPPIHPSSMDDPPPESIVLDAQAYLDDRTNASTAKGCTARGHRIKVAFWISHPPRVSYFTVHFPDLPDPSGGELGQLPRIVRTDGDLVLLHVSVCPPGLRIRPEFNDLIIYRAGSKTLQVLPPNPDRKRIPLYGQVGLLDCHDNTGSFFVVAALSSVYRRGHYKLELYDSRKRTWSTKPMYVEPSQAHDYSFTSPTKVITIGGKRGSIGFVDLLQGILICDVLMGDDILRYIRLPFLVAPNKMCRGPPTCDRDITISQGYIKYFDMCVHAEPGSCIGTSYTSQDWEAATWKWVDSEKNWHMEYKLKASNVLVDKSHYELLPNPLHPHGPTEMKPILSRLHVGHPALSMHDDIVYIMAKVHHMDSHKAWMLAVDMRNKTLNGVTDFSPERTFSFSLTYLQSKISKHLAKRSSNSRHSEGEVCHHASVEVSDYC